MIFWLSITIAVLSYLMGAGSLMTDAGLDPLFVKKMLSIVAILVGVGNTVLAVMTKPQVVNSVLTKLYLR